TWNILKLPTYLYIITNMTSTRHEGTGRAGCLPYTHTIAEWISRRLSLLDEGNYDCYVSTANGSTRNKVVLKVGAFLTPVMKYEKRNTSSFLICSVFSVYPRPVITWKTDSSTPVSEKNTGEIGPLGSFYINSTQNITGSNSSYECTIKNSLLKQTWMGRWTKEGGLHNKQGEHVSLSCQFGSNFSLLNQDFRVTWSRVENGMSSVLASYLSSSQKMIISEPRLSLNKELISQRDFSVNLINLRLLDSGEYLCNISSSKYTLLTIHTLHLELNQGTASQNRYQWIWAGLAIVVFLILAVSCYAVYNRSNTETKGHSYPADGVQPERSHVSTDERASNTDNAEENMPLLGSL
uniref:Ig-like domain-containing protein n=1 Tax=Otolemur garnettii TaxID=30611 RepID=H0WL05_OTOGA